MSRREPVGKAGNASPFWGVGLVALAAGAAVLAVAALAHRRSEEASGTLESSVAPAEAEPASRPSLERLLAAAESPDASVRVLDAAAHALLVSDQFEEAEALTARMLEASPGDAEAAIHRATLRGVFGESKAARQELEALSAGPAGWEASLLLAGFALREGDEQAALRLLRRVSEEAPAAEVTDALRAEISELEKRLARPGAHQSLKKQP